MKVHEPRNMQTSQQVLHKLAGSQKYRTLSKLPAKERNAEERQKSRAQALKKGRRQLQIILITAPKQHSLTRRLSQCVCSYPCLNIAPATKYHPMSSYFSQ